MMTWILFKGFMRKEFKQALRDPRMRFLLFGTPVIQLVIFGVALSTDVKNIRLWANPLPNDFVLQHIYQHSIASGWFLPVSEAEKEALAERPSPFDLLRAGEIDAAMIDPPGGLTKDIGRGTGKLQLLVDSMNVIQAQSVESYIKSISADVISDDFKTSITKPPIYFNVRVLYNPSLETAFFMVPGVMVILMCLTTVMLTSMSIAREKEMGTFELLISAPISGKAIVLGKTVPFVVIGLINAPLILAVAVFLFRVPMQGSLLVMALAAFVFVCSTVSIGTLIATIAKNQQQAMLGGFLFLFPAILLSGMMFPIDNMPEILKWLAYMDPLSHFLELVRNLMLKGGEARFIFKQIGILAGMAVLFVGLSFLHFKTTLTD